MNSLIKYSIVVLTHNRPDRVKQYLLHFEKLKGEDVEFIIVDNCSEIPVSEIVDDSRYKIVRNNHNLGAVGRNRGIEVALGGIIITLDDDVYGIDRSHLNTLSRVFEDKGIAAINFMVLEEGTGTVVNWCHPCDPDKFSRKVFETNQISEGAVAFSRNALLSTALYPISYFISHEGPDLAFQIMRNGYRLIYSPEIVVNHCFEEISRASWRRYYYDTRNLLWLVVRNASVAYGMKKIIIGWGAMLIYSLRDGFFRYWLKGVVDAIKEIKGVYAGRVVPTKELNQRIREIEKNRIGFFKMVKKRLFSKSVRI